VRCIELLEAGVARLGDGMLEVALAAKCTEEASAEVPGDDERQGIEKDQVAETYTDGWKDIMAAQIGQNKERESGMMYM